MKIRTGKASRANSWKANGPMHAVRAQDNYMVYYLMRQI